MIKIKLTRNGFVCGQENILELFKQTCKVDVTVTCKEPCYKDVHTFENEVCKYMSSLMPDNIQVKTHHVTPELNDGTDCNGKYYIIDLCFQVYI